MAVYGVGAGLALFSFFTYSSPRLPPSEKSFFLSLLLSPKLVFPAPPPPLCVL